MATHEQMKAAADEAIAFGEKWNFPPEERRVAIYLRELLAEVGRLKRERDAIARVAEWSFCLMVGDGFPAESLERGMDRPLESIAAKMIGWAPGAVRSAAGLDPADAGEAKEGK